MRQLDVNMFSLEGRKSLSGGSLGEGDRLSRGQAETPLAPPRPNSANVSFAAPPEFRNKVKDEFFY